VEALRLLVVCCLPSEAHRTIDDADRAVSRRAGAECNPENNHSVCSLGDYFLTNSRNHRRTAIFTYQDLSNNGNPLEHSHSHSCDCIPSWPVFLVQHLIGDLIHSGTVSLMIVDNDLFGQLATVQRRSMRNTPINACLAIVDCVLFTYIVPGKQKQQGPIDPAFTLYSRSPSSAQITLS
jgi:hypothetical protein